MAHQSLYRKYRPQTFDDVVGQEHITRTLRNAVDEDSVSHAYLFCGPRGTGKTTTARILAKALDCASGPTGQPDDTCESCREIAEGRHPDVYELDAASRTGVDAVRDEIITKVNYAATRGPFKVYIIDEVHMLSTSAFNALLKTLEEPPSHAVFILCTTHPHKVPETIQSRCQRFDFRRISVDDIVGRLEVIAGREGISVEAGVPALIARHSAGGLRDAIGTLDQLASFTGKSVAVADVEGLLGEVDIARLREAVDLIAVRDAAGCFRFTAALAESGHDVPEFVRGLTAYVRDMYATAASGDADGIVDATGQELEALRGQVALFDIDRLGRLLDQLGQLVAELRWAPDPRLSLEVAFVRIARPQADLTIEALAERVSALEAGAPALPVLAPVPSPHPVSPSPTPADRPAAAAAPSPPVTGRDEAPPAPPVERSGSAVTPEPMSATTAAPRVPAGATLDRAALRRAWDDILREVRTVKPATSKLFLETEVDLDGDMLVVEFAPDRRVPMQIADDQPTKDLLRRAVEHVTGHRLAIRYQLGRGSVRHEEAADAGESPGASAGVTDQGDTPAIAGDAASMLIDSLGAEVVAERQDGEEPPR